MRKVTTRTAESYYQALKRKNMNFPTRMIIMGPQYHPILAIILFRTHLFVRSRQPGSRSSDPAFPNRAPATRARIPGEPAKRDPLSSNYVYAGRGMPAPGCRPEKMLPPPPHPSPQGCPSMEGSGGSIRRQKAEVSCKDPGSGGGSQLPFLRRSASTFRGYGNETC